MKPAVIVSRLAEFLPAELRRTRRVLRRANGRHSGEAVHEARKSIKRMRASLRLAEEMAPARMVAAVESALHDAAQALGPLRDQLVLTETGRDLANKGKTPPVPEPPPAAPMLKRASERLRRAAGSLSRLVEAGFDEDGVHAGLRRLYKRAAREMENARKNNSDEILHAWRRRSKDLLYVLELIHAPAPLVKKLDKLASLLGDDHDLATFIVHHNSSSENETQGHFLSRAKKRRGPLQKKAFRIGEKLFDTSPRKFVRRLAA